jgi:hypothetical protein
MAGLEHLVKEIMVELTLLERIMVAAAEEDLALLDLLEHLEVLVTEDLAQHLQLAEQQ